LNVSLVLSVDFDVGVVKDKENNDGV